MSDFGIQGETVPALQTLARDSSSEVLTSLLLEVEGDAHTELRRLLDLVSGKKEVRVWLSPVRTTTRPYMVGPDQNQRYWSRHGDLYTCVHSGTFRGGKLEMVPADQEDTVFIWLCLAGTPEG